MSSSLLTPPGQRMESGLGNAQLAVIGFENVEELKQFPWPRIINGLMQ
jgi:hypothetical protein